MYKKEKSAYLTIEASLVIPAVIGGIVFVLYIGFYLYNLATIQQTAYIAALRGSQIKRVSSIQIQNYVEEQVDELLSGKILAKENIRTEVKVSVSSIKVKIYTNVKIIFLSLLPLEEKDWEIKGEAQVNRVNPIKIIRGVRRIDGH